MFHNDIAISTRTPPGWIEWSLKATQLPYFHCHGENVLDVYTQSQEAAALCRKKGIPVFIHMTCGRMFNHAGADSGSYYTPADIRGIVSRDPLPYVAGQLIEEGLATHREILDRYNDIEAKTLEKLDQADKVSSDGFVLIAFLYIYIYKERSERSIHK